MFMSETGSDQDIIRYRFGGLVWGWWGVPFCKSAPQNPVLDTTFSIVFFSQIGKPLFSLAFEIP